MLRQFLVLILVALSIPMVTAAVTDAHGQTLSTAANTGGGGFVFKALKNLTAEIIITRESGNTDGDDWYLEWRNGTSIASNTSNLNTNISFYYEFDAGDEFRIWGDEGGATYNRQYLGACGMPFGGTNVNYTTGWHDGLSAEQDSCFNIESITTTERAAPPPSNTSYVGLTKQLYTREATPGITIQDTAYASVDSFNFTVNDAGVHWVTSTLQLTGINSGDGQCRISINGTSIDSMASRTTTAGSVGSLQLMSEPLNLSATTHTASIECKRSVPAKYSVDLINTFVHGMVASNGTALSHNYRRYTNITTTQTFNITTSTGSISNSTRYLVVEAKTDGEFQTNGVAIDAIDISGVNDNSIIQRYGTAGTSGSWGLVNAINISDSNATVYNISYNVTANNALRNIWVHAYEVIIPDTSIYFNHSTGATTSSGFTSLYQQNISYPIGGSYVLYGHADIRLNISSGSDTAGAFYSLAGTNTTQYNRSVSVNAGVIDVIGSVNASGTTDKVTSTVLYRASGNLSYTTNSLVMVTDGRTTASEQYVISVYDSITAATVNVFNATVNGVAYTSTNGSIVVPADQDTDNIVISASNYFTNTTTTDGLSDTSIGLRPYTEVRVIVNAGLNAPYNDQHAEIGSFVILYNNGTANGTITTDSFVAYTPLEVADYVIQLRNLTNINVTSNITLSGTVSTDASRGAGSSPGIQILFYENITLNTVNIINGDGADVIQVWNGAILEGSANIVNDSATFSGLNLTKGVTYKVVGKYNNTGTSKYLANCTGGYFGWASDNVSLAYIVEGLNYQNSTRANDCYAISKLNIKALTGSYANSDQNISITTYPPHYNFTTYLTNTFNITWYWETNNSLATGYNIDFQLISNSYATNGTTTSGDTELTLLVPSNYTIRYFENAEAPRDYYVELLEGSYNNLRLYIVQANISSYYLPVVTDANDEPCEDLTISLMRYYVDINGYRVVEMAKTDTNGQGVLRVVPNVINYKLFLNGACGTFTTAPQKIVSNTDRFTVVGSQTVLTSAYSIRGASINMTYNNNTRTYVFDWLDTSNIILQGCLYVYKTESGKKTTNYTACTNASSGSLIYTIPGNQTNTVWTAKGTLDTSTTYSLYSFLGEEVSFLQSIDTWGVTGMFYGMLLIMAVVLMSATSALTLVFGAIGSLAVLITLGIIAGGSSVVGGLLIVLAILLYKFKS